MNHNPYSVGEQPTFGDTGMQGPKFEASVRTMQIIVVALMMGVLSCLLVVLLTTKGNVLGLNKPTLMTLIAAGFGFLMIVNHFVIPGIISKAQLKQTASNELPEGGEESKQQHVVAIFQTQLIIGMALLEGAAFFNLVELMIDKSGFSLGIVILLMSLMLMKFPTRDKVSFWVQDRMRESGLW